jgi:WD40 repeat protein
MAEERVSLRLPAEGHRHLNVSWSGNGRRIIIFQCEHCGQKIATILDLPTAQVLRQWSVENNKIQAAALSEDGTRAAVGDGKTIRIWDVETGAEDPPLIGHAATISVLQFADQGRTLFSGDLHGELRRWSVTDAREIWSVP